MTEIATILPEIPAVAPQVAPVLSGVAQILPQLAPVSVSPILPHFLAVVAQLSPVLLHFTPVVPDLVAVVSRAGLRGKRRGGNTQGEHHSVEHNAFHHSSPPAAGALCLPLRWTGRLPPALLRYTALTFVVRLKADPARRLDGRSLWPGRVRGDMSATPSTMLDLGTALPPFRLPRLGGGDVASSDFDDAPALLVVFICPHCPFMKHIRRELGRFSAEYTARGLAMAGINANDESAYPDDGWDGMQAEAADGGYAFAYLRDESQAVAKSFRAACTPDFFLFDRARRLVYRGQFDASRPRNDVPVTGSDLRAACDEVLAGRMPSADQRSSIGCNIKWKPGNTPDYFTR